ncbi:MAG: ChaN family lipoprotein [bacterium]
MVITPNPSTLSSRICPSTSSLTTLLAGRAGRAARVLLGLIALLMLSACTHLAPVTKVDGPAPGTPWKSSLSRENKLVGEIIDTHNGQTITADMLLTRLRSTPLVLIGEKHDNPDHHRIEGWLIRNLVSEGTTVVFEMLDDRQRKALSLKPPRSISLEALKQALQWDDKSWVWKDYGPLFQTVVARGGILSPGNIDRSMMMDIYSKGNDALEGQERFATVAKVWEKNNTFMLDKVYESHCGKMPREHLGGMVSIQMAKDASMASALESALKFAASEVEATPIALLIAGGAHQLKQSGVPQHLDLKGLEYLTVQLVEVEKGIHNWKDILRENEGVDPASETDFLWFTPRFTDRDYCADLDKQEGKKANRQPKTEKK